MKVPAWMRRRHQDFAIVFGSPQGRNVLASIRKFVRSVPSFSPNPVELARAHGRAEVLRYLEETIGWDEGTLATVYTDYESYRRQEAIREQEDAA